MSTRAAPLAGLIALGLLVFGVLLFARSGDHVRGVQAGEPSGQVEQLRSGSELYLQSCASCHGVDGRGGPSGPSLVGVGPANLDFQMWTGRMPLAAPDAPGYRQRPSLTEAQISAITEHAVRAFAGPSPAIPQVVTARGDLQRGWELYTNNCSACHGTSAAGAAIGAGNVAPGLGRVDAVRLAEATIVGPGVMPAFGFSQQQLDDLAAYVAFLNDLPTPGGLPLAGVGPVPEGFIAGFLGLGALILVARFVAPAERT